MNTKRRAKTKSLSEFAYNHLIDKLLTGQLVPGDLLNRRQIAAELKISVAPVLEAVVQLENDGFLESIPRKGTLVKAIKPSDLRGQLILREALECEAARLYCGEKIVANRESLIPLADEAEMNYPNIEKGWRSEFNFHRALVALADCPPLLSIYEKIMHYKLFMAQNLFLRSHTVEESSHDNHRRLLTELETTDPDKAERIIRQHIRSGKSMIIETL